MTDNYSTTIYGSEFNRVEYTLPDDSSGTTFYYLPTSDSGSIVPSFSLNIKELGISNATNVAYSDNIIFIAVDNTIKVYQYSNDNWVHIQDISPRDSTETNFGKYISFSYNNQNVSVVSEDSTGVYRNDYAIQKYLPTSMVDNESTFQDNTDDTVIYSNYNTLATVQEDIGEIEPLSLNFELTNSQQPGFIGNVTFNNLSSFKIWVSDDDTPITRCQYLGIDKTDSGIDLYYTNHNGPSTISLSLESGTTYTAPTFSYYSYIALNNYVMESVYLLYDSSPINIVYYDTSSEVIVGNTTWDGFSSASHFLPYQPGNSVWSDNFDGHSPNYSSYNQPGDNWAAYPAIKDDNTDGTNDPTLLGNVIFVGETNVSHVVAQVINNIELTTETNKSDYEKPDVYVVIEPSDTNSDSKVYIRPYDYSNNAYRSGDDLVKYEVDFSTSPGRINDICITNDGSYVFLIAENGIFYRTKTYNHQEIVGNNGKHINKIYSDFTYIENSNNINWTGIALSYNTSHLNTTDTLYVTAVSEDGIYKVSTTSIEKVSSLTDWTTVSVSKDGKYQVAASSSEGLYYSEDFGETWNLKDSAKTDFKKIQILANGKIIYYTATTITQSNLNTIIFENPFDTSKDHFITSPNNSYTFNYNFANDKIGTDTDNQYYLLYTEENNQVISSFATETVITSLDIKEYEDYAVFQLTKEGNLEYRPAKIYEPPQPYRYPRYNSETNSYDEIFLDYRPTPPPISSNSGDMGVDKVALNNSGNLILLTKDNRWVLTGEEITFTGATSSSLSGDGDAVVISDSSSIKKYNYSDGNWVEDTLAQKTGTYGVLSNDGNSLYYIVNTDSVYKDNDLLFSSGNQNRPFKQLLINKDSYSNNVDTVRLLVLQEFDNNGSTNSSIYIYRKNNGSWGSSGFGRDGDGNASISFDETGYIAGLRFLEENQTTYKTFILIDGDFFSTIFESTNDGPNSHFSLSSTGQNMILNTTSVETLQLSSNVLTLDYTPPIDDTDGINITVPYLQNRTYSSLPLTVDVDTLVKNLEKTIDEDNTLTINLNDEIRWESNEILVYNIQTQPTIGTVQIQNGETLVYTPNANVFDTSQGDLIVVRANINGDSNNYFDSYIRIYINSVFDKTTGSVSIGTTNPYPENTLSASVTLIDGDIDTNNLIVSYQWYYVDSSNDTVYDSSTWTLIEGATNSSYPIPGENDQVGKNIAVRVTAEDTSDSLIPEIFTSNIVQVINFVSSTNISLEVNKGETFTYNLDSLEVESAYPVTFSVSSYESNDGTVAIDSNGDVIFTPISTQFNQTTIFVINASIDTSITTFVSPITFTLEYNNADIVETVSTYQELPFIYNLDSLNLIEVTNYTIISEPTSNSVSFEGEIGNSTNPKRVIYTPGTFTESSQNVTITLESQKGGSGDPVDTIKFTVTVYQQPTISGTVEYGHTVSVDTTGVSTTTYPTINYTDYTWELTNEEDFSNFTEVSGESFEIASDLNAEFIRYKVTVTNDYGTNQVIYSEKKHIISTYNSLDQQVDDNLLTSITLPNFYYNKLVTYSNPITNDSNTIIIKNLIQNWNLSSTITTNQSLIDAAQDAFIVSDGTNITVYKNNNGTWETVGNFTDTFTNITSVSVVSDSFIYLNTSDTFYSYKYSNVAAYLYPNGTTTSQFFKQIGNVDTDKFTIVSLEDTLKSFSLIDLTSYTNMNSTTNEAFNSSFDDLLSFHIFVSDEDQRLAYLRAVSLDKIGNESLVLRYINNNGFRTYEYTGPQYTTGTTYMTPTEGSFAYVAYTDRLLELNRAFSGLSIKSQTEYSRGQTIDGNNITHVISSLSEDQTIYPYVYVATEGGFYRSEYGSERAAYGQIGGITNVTDLAITNDGQYVYVATTSGLYYSNDFGGTFNTVGNSSSSWLGVAVGYNHTESTSEPYASAFTSSGEIYTNSDWNNPVETNFTGLKSITSSADGQYQIIASTSGIYYSQDFGSTWELRNNTDTNYDNILMCADGQVFAYNSTTINESNINAMIPVSSYSDTLVSDYSFNFIRNSTDGTTVNVQDNNANTFATFYNSSQERLQAFLQLSVSGNLEFYDAYGRTSPTLQSNTSNMGVTKLQLDSDGNLLLVADSESWMKINEVGASTSYRSNDGYGMGTAFGNVTDSALTLLAKNAIVYTESEGKVMFLYENLSYSNSSLDNENDGTLYNYQVVGTGYSGVSSLNIGDNIFCYLYEDNGSNTLLIYKFTSTSISTFITDEYEVVNGGRIYYSYVRDGDYSQVKLKNNLIAMLTSDYNYIHFLEYRPDADDTIKMYLQGSIDLGTGNTDASISLDNIAFIITVNYTDNSSTNHQKIYSYNPASSEWEVTSSSSLNNPVLGGENLFDLENSSIKIYELESQLQVETEGVGEAYVSFNVNNNNDTVERFINITSGSSLLQGTTLTVDEDSIGNTFNLNDYKVDESQNLIYEIDENPDYGSASINENILTYSTQVNNYYGETKIKIKATVDGDSSSVDYTTFIINIVNVADTTTGSVSVSGILAVGQTLTATATLENVDILGTISAYEWYFSTDNISWSQDVDLTSSQISITSDNVGKYVKVKVVITEDEAHGGTTEIESSSSSSVITSGIPTISGDVYEGQTVTADASFYSFDGQQVTISDYSWTINDDDIKPILHYIQSWSNCGINSSQPFTQIQDTTGYVVGSSLLTWGCENYDTGLQFVQVQESTPNANTNYHPPRDVGTKGIFVVEEPEINGSSYTIGSAFYGEELKVKVTVNNVEYQSIGYKINDETFFNLGIESNVTTETETLATIPLPNLYPTDTTYLTTYSNFVASDTNFIRTLEPVNSLVEEDSGTLSDVTSSNASKNLQYIVKNSSEDTIGVYNFSSSGVSPISGGIGQPPNSFYVVHHRSDGYENLFYYDYNAINSGIHDEGQAFYDYLIANPNYYIMIPAYSGDTLYTYTAASHSGTYFYTNLRDSDGNKPEPPQNWATTVYVFESIPEYYSYSGDLNFVKSFTSFGDKVWINQDGTRIAATASFSPNEQSEKWLTQNFYFYYQGGSNGGFHIWKAGYYKDDSRDFVADDLLVTFTMNTSHNTYSSSSFELLSTGGTNPSPLIVGKYLTNLYLQITGSFYVSLNGEYQFRFQTGYANMRFYLNDQVYDMNSSGSGDGTDKWTGTPVNSDAHTPSIQLSNLTRYNFKIEYMVLDNGTDMLNDIKFDHPNIFITPEGESTTTGVGGQGWARTEYIQTLQTDQKYLYRWYKVYNTVYTGGTSYGGQDSSIYDQSIAELMSFSAPSVEYTDTLSTWWSDNNNTSSTKTIDYPNDWYDETLTSINYKSIPGDSDYYYYYYVQTIGSFTSSEDRWYTFLFTTDDGIRMTVSDSLDGLENSANQLTFPDNGTVAAWSGHGATTFVSDAILLTADKTYYFMIEFIQGWGGSVFVGPRIHQSLGSSEGNLHYSKYNWDNDDDSGRRLLTINTFEGYNYNWYKLNPTTNTYIYDYNQDNNIWEQKYMIEGDAQPNKDLTQFVHKGFNTDSDFNPAIITTDLSNIDNPSTSTTTIENVGGVNTISWDGTTVIVETSDYEIIWVTNLDTSEYERSNGYFFDDVNVNFIKYSSDDLSTSTTISTTLTKNTNAIVINSNTIAFEIDSTIYILDLNDTSSISSLPGKAPISISDDEGTVVFQNGDNSAVKYIRYNGSSWEPYASHEQTVQNNIINESGETLLLLDGTDVKTYNLEQKLEITYQGEQGDADIDFDIYNGVSYDRFISVENSVLVEDKVITVDEDNSITYNLNNMRIDDTKTLTYSIISYSSLDGNGEIINGINLKYTPNENNTNTNVFTIEATYDDITQTATVTINVNPSTDPTTGSVSITGTPLPKQTLTAEVSVSDPDYDSSSLIIAYQWQMSDNSNWDSSDLNVGTESTFTLPDTNDNAGKYIRVVITVTDPTDSSNPTDFTSNTVQIEELQLVYTNEILGTTTEDVSFEVNLLDSNIFNTGYTLTFATESEQNGSVNIDNNTLTFTPDSNFPESADSGLASFILEVGTDTNETTITQSIIYYITVTQDNDEPTGTVSISGTPLPNQTLTAITSAITDVESDSLVFTYQWQMSGGTNDDGYENISGATNSSYTLPDTNDNANKYVKVIVTAYENDINDSNPTDFTSNAVQIQTLNLVTGISVSGSVYENNTFTYDLDNIVNTDYTVYFSVEDSTQASINSNNQLIFNAPTVDSNTDEIIKVIASTDTSVTTITQEITFTVTVIDNTDATGKPDIEGFLCVGKTLTANVDLITDIEDSSTDFTYKWYFSYNGTDWTHDSNNTQSTIVLTSSELGQYVKVETTVTDKYGGITVLTSDNSTSFVTDGIPTITGYIAVGAEVTVNTNNIKYNGGTNQSFYYVWLVDGTPDNSKLNNTTITVPSGSQLQVIVSWQNDTNTIFESATYSIITTYDATYNALNVATKNQTETTTTITLPNFNPTTDTENIVTYTNVESNDTSFLSVNLNPNWKEYGQSLFGDTNNTGQDKFGISVALSKDGKTMIVGAPSDTNDDYSVSTNVYVYVYNEIDENNKIWEQKGDSLFDVISNSSIKPDWFYATNPFMKLGEEVYINPDGSKVAIFGEYEVSGDLYNKSITYYESMPLGTLYTSEIKTWGNLTQFSNIAASGDYFTTNWYYRYLQVTGSFTVTENGYYTFNASTDNGVRITVVEETDLGSLYAGDNGHYVIDPNLQAYNGNTAVAWSNHGELEYRDNMYLEKEKTYYALIEYSQESGGAKFRYIEVAYLGLNSEIAQDTDNLESNYAIFYDWNNTDSNLQLKSGKFWYKWYEYDFSATDAYDKTIADYTGTPIKWTYADSIQTWTDSSGLNDVSGISGNVYVQVVGSFTVSTQDNYTFNFDVGTNALRFTIVEENKWFENSLGNVINKWNSNDSTTTGTISLDSSKTYNFMIEYGNGSSPNFSYQTWSTNLSLNDTAFQYNWYYGFNNLQTIYMFEYIDNNWQLDAYLPHYAKPDTELTEYIMLESPKISIFTPTGPNEWTGNAMNFGEYQLVKWCGNTNFMFIFKGTTLYSENTPIEVYERTDSGIYSFKNTFSPYNNIITISESAISVTPDGNYILLGSESNYNYVTKIYQGENKFSFSNNNFDDAYYGNIPFLSSQKRTNEYTPVQQNCVDLTYSYFRYDVYDNSYENYDYSTYFSNSVVTHDTKYVEIKGVFEANDGTYTFNVSATLTNYNDNNDVISVVSNEAVTLNGTYEFTIRTTSDTAITVNESAMEDVFTMTTKYNLLREVGVDLTNVSYETYGLGQKLRVPALESNTNIYYINQENGITFDTSNGKYVIVAENWDNSLDINIPKDARTYTPDGNINFLFQSDDNVVIYDAGQAIYSTGTHGYSNAVTTFTKNGVLQVQGYSDSIADSSELKEISDTGFQGNVLAMDKDGNLAIIETTFEIVDISISPYNYTYNVYANPWGGGSMVYKKDDDDQYKLFGNMIMSNEDINNPSNAWGGYSTSISDDGFTYASTYSRATVEGNTTDYGADHGMVRIFRYNPYGKSVHNFNGEGITTTNVVILRDTETLNVGDNSISSDNNSWTFSISSTKIELTDNNNNNTVWSQSGTNIGSLSCYNGNLLLFNTDNELIWTLITDSSSATLVLDNNGNLSLVENWLEYGSYLNNSTTVDANSGVGLALSSNGEIVALGAPQDDTYSNDDGKVTVYQLNQDLDITYEGNGDANITFDVNNEVVPLTERYINIKNTHLINDSTWTVQEDDSSRIFNLNDMNHTSSELTYSISGAPSLYSTFELEGTELIYEPAPNYYGTDSVTVTATTGTSSQTATLTIITESVNDTPVFLSTNPGNQEIEPEVPFEYNIIIQDIEISDIPILTISGEPSWLTLSGTNSDDEMTTKNDSGYFTATLSGTPEKNNAGKSTIILTVTDGSDSTLSNTQSFTIEVGGLVQDQTYDVNEDDPTQIDLNIMRVDSSLDLVYEIVTYDTNVGSAEITDSSLDILEYTTALHNTNGNQITIRATNVADSSQTTTGILTINVIPIADPTTGSVSVDGTPLPNQTLTAEVSVSDPDYDSSSLIIAYQWQMSDNSNWDSSDLNVGTESTFTLPDTNDNAGKYIRVVITVTDPTDSSNPTDFTSNTVQIEELQLVYTNEILGTTTEDVGFVVNLSDSNIFNTGYTLSFTTESEQNGSIEIDNVNNSLTFTPDPNFPESADSGLASFILEVGTDTNETTITQSIIYYITVTQDNDEPTGTVSISGTPLPNQTLTAVTSAITDVESDSLVFTYQWQMSSDNTTWDSDVSNSSTYTLPDTNDNASKYIKVIVTAYENDTSDSNPTDFTSNAVQIQTLNLVNDTSVSININEDTTFTQDLSGYVQDSAEYPINFSIKSFESNFGDATIDTNNDLIFVPIANVNGDTTIVVTASTDSTLTSITQDITFNLTINEVPDDAVGEISFTGFYNVGGTLTVNKNITDVDGTLNSSNYSYQWYTLSDSSHLTYDSTTWNEITPTETIEVTASGGKYTINGETAPILNFKVGTTYTLNYPTVHPLRFSTDSNNITEYTEDVSVGTGTITILITDETPSTLYYYCTQHSNMGGEINISKNTELYLDSNYSGVIIGVKVTTNVGGITEFSYSPGIYVGNGVVELLNSTEGNNQLTEGCTTTVNTSGFIYFEGDTSGGNTQLELEDSSTDTSDTERFWYRWYFTKDSSAEIEEIPTDVQSIQSINSVDDTGSVWKLFNQVNYNKNYFEIPDTQIMVNGWLKVSIEYDNQTFYSTSYYIENVDDPIQVSELSITGFYNVGGTLTINKNITDDDGLDTNTFEYQWYTILDSSSSTYDSATWTPINNATEETLTLDDSNLSGVIIGFRITITDLQGTVNYVSYSPGIETGSGEIFLYTDTSNPDVPATEVYEGKDVTINSNGLVYIENGNIQENLTHSGNPVDSSNAFKYEWYYNQDSNNKDTPIDSSNGWERYKYNTGNKDTVEIDNSQQIVGWFFAATITYAGEIYSTPALQAENVDDPLTNKSITFSGFYEVNKDITAEITFQEVDTYEKYQITWYRVNNDSSTEVQTELVDDSSLNKDVDTVSTYTIKNSDVGHSLKVVVSVTDNFGTVESFEQSITEVIDNSALVITGTVEEGATLTADVSAIVYIGDSNLEPSAYQWYVRQDTGEEWTIPEINIVSNLEIFEIPDTQQLVGYYVKCEVTYIPDSSDTSKTVIFDADVGPVENVDDPAVDSNNGFERYGYSGLINLRGALFANTSFLSDEDELDTSGFTFRWYYTPQRDDTNERILLESSNYTSPTDESSLQLSDDYLTDSSQTLVGKFIVLQVDTLDKFGGSQTFEYTASTEVRNGIPIITGSDDDKRTVEEGVVEEGTKVDVKKTSENYVGIQVINDRYWDDVVKKQDGSNFKDYTYQWQLSDDGINNWTDLEQDTQYIGTDPTSFQYLIPDDQEFVGKYLRARVTVFENSNYVYYTDAAQIENTEDEATGTITISGLYQVNQTLYATTNITDIDDSNLEYKYTWKRSVDKNIWISFSIESTPVSESTTSVVIPSDSAGEYIQLEVTTIDQYGGETVLTETINDTVKTGQASFLGIVMPGKTLTAVTTEILYIGDDSGSSEYTYQWQISTGTSNSDFVNIQDVIDIRTTGSTGQEVTYIIPETNDYKNRYVRVIVNYEYPTETNLYESVTNAQQIQVLASILCFTGDAIITTDQGDIPLQDLTYNHTVGKNRIKFICKTYYVERELVHIPKDALGPNYPNQDTYCSLDHKIQYKGKFYKAEELWDRVQALNLVPYSGELLYNVMLEHRNTMIINNMVTESLNKFYMRKFRRMGLYERQCLE